MSVTLWLALLVQFATVCLLRAGLGKDWLRRPATLLVLASVLYDGLSQVLLSFPQARQWDGYLAGVAPRYADTAALILSVAMLAFAACFLLTGRGSQEPPRPGDAMLAARVTDWRVLALACVPLAVATYEGRGYNGLAGAQAAGPSPGFASTFFVIVVTLASAGFVLRHGTRWFLPVLAAQSLVLAAAGERSPVAASALGLILILARAGMRPPAAKLTAAALLTGTVTAAIMGARTDQGRAVFQQASGVQARVTALAGGVRAAEVPGTPGLAAQLAVRLDGTSFAAAVLQGHALGQPRLNPEGVPESVLQGVPRAVWASKPEAGDALNPYQAQISDFGLQNVNYLPTFPGLYAGYMAWPWLAVLLGALGAAWGLAEKRILARCTPARLILLAGAVQAAVAYEAGLPGMIVAFRPALVLAVAAWCWQALRLPRYQAGISVSDRMVPSP
jgi:hypothetical protein